MAAVEPARWRDWRATYQRLRRPLSVAAFVLLTLGGAWLGLLVAGGSHEPVGPVQTTMRVLPSLYGDATVELPPLGTLAIDSHDGPLGMQLTVDRIDREDAERIFADPALISGLQQRVVSDLRRGAEMAAIRGFFAAVLGAGVLTLVVVRRVRRALAAGGLAAAVMLGSYGAAAATWDPGAVTEPRYTGLLTSAPSLIGTAEDIARNLNTYSTILVKLVTNVTRLYDVTSTLPTYSPSGDVIRVLHVSDLHLNEYSWNIIRSVSRQFDVDLIVDSGDTTDHGTAAENGYLDPIAGLGVPYVWVRGNHDSTVTEEAMRELPNVVVLDGDRVQTVEGLRFLGAGDPRFTPDRATRQNVGRRDVVAQALALTKVARRSDPPPDVIVFHDSTVDGVFDGAVPLVLSGHEHVRKRYVMPHGTRVMEEGSTGGSGLRALDNGADKPTPITLSVLYLDRDTKRLEAWDDITLGGLGQVSAQIERHQVPRAEEQQQPKTPTPVPSPSGPVPDTPLPTPTFTYEAPSDSPAGSPSTTPPSTAPPSGSPRPPPLGQRGGAGAGPTGQ